MASTRTTKPTAAKRGQNAGTITLRADGAAIARVTDPTTGKRKSRIVRRQNRPNGKPETDAQLKFRALTTLAALLAEVTRPATLRESWSFERYATERYLPTLTTAGRAATTIDSYTNYLANLVNPYIGTLDLARITVDAIDDLDATLRDKGKSLATRRHARQAVSRVLGHAVSKRRLSHNVARDADRLAADRRDRTAGVLEPAKVLEILTASRKFEGGRWELAVALLAVLGLRRGEVLGLGWDAVDLDAATLTVRRNLTPLSGGRLSFGEPKTAASVATLELPGNVVALLRAHRVEQAAQRLAVGPAWSPGLLDTTGEVVDLVFRLEDGSPVRPHRLTAAVERLAKSAAIDRKVTPHLLRHGYASLLLAKGHDLAAVSAAMRHASPAVTAAVYSHALASTRKAATVAMAEAVGAW